jgi:hypothetical protein
MAQTYKLQLTEEELQFIETGIQTAIEFNKTIVSWGSTKRAESALNLKTLASLEAKINKLKNVINDDAN